MAPISAEEALKYTDPENSQGEREQFAQQIAEAHQAHEQWRASRSETEQRQLADVPITHIPEGFEERAQASRAEVVSATDVQPPTNGGELTQGERDELNRLRAEAQQHGWTP